MSNNPTKLSDEELIDRLIATNGEGGLFPTAEQWRALLSSDHTGALVMANLFRLRERAYDPADPESDASGVDAFRQYATAMGPVLARFGARILSSGQVFTHFIGSGGGTWNVAATNRYPTISRYVSMCLDPEYGKAQRYKRAAAEATQLYAVIPFPG